MEKFQKIARVLTVTVFTFTAGSTMAGIELEFKFNTNKLPMCPKPDYSKKHDIGFGGRTEKWNNCWGKYKVEFGKEHKGDVLEGEWRNGVLHGQGMYFHANGDKYVGEFKDSYSHGRGTYISAKGDKYVGEFKEFNKHGKGTLTSPDGETYVGEFKDDKRHGRGTLTWADGERYVGEFKDDKRHGQGTYTLAKGHGYTGQWVDGKPHGKGRQFFSDGRQPNEGIFENGTFVRAEKIDPPSAFDLPTGESLANDFDNDLFAIPPVYDLVQDFSEGLAAFRIGDSATGKWGFIDKKGKVVVAPQFDEVGLFKEGLAPVRFGNKQEGKWGYINKAGILVISAKFNSASSFYESLASVSIGTKDAKKYGFIDRQGNFKIQPEFDWAFGFSEGAAPVMFGSLGNGKWGYIDKSGKFIVEPQFYHAAGFTEGLAAVSRGSLDSGEKWGFIDKKGNVVVDFKFDWVFLSFAEGLAGVRIGTWENGKWGFIDKKGNYVVPPKFDGAYPFSQGLAAVRVGDEKSGLWGFIKNNGQFSIFPQFRTAVQFKDGLAPISTERSGKQKIGYVDANGKLVIPPQFLRYDELPAQFFSDGLAPSCVKLGGAVKCGFIAQSVHEAAIISGRQSIRDKQLSNQGLPRIFLQVSPTSPDTDGNFLINIQTSADTASLKINGEEQGGRADGKYTIKRVARVGQDTQFTITAVDVYGNSDTKTITVARQAGSVTETPIALKPEAIKRAPARDAVAIIIGIQDYKRVPKADFSNKDAKEFYEYAVRALGVKPDKIKMLIDDEADEVNIVKAFENWLPIQVNKDKTDIYVFFSGHGLPAPDGKSLYFLPHGVDKELLSRTAVSQSDIVAALSAAKPKSVTMFIDACYSGQTRGGDILVANAKPVSLKSDTNAYPPNFTVITASANDQISSSSPELKHGIFSFYLMKGMEGEADANRDGRITVGEMQEYLSDKVSRQAMTLNRKQTTQLLGDAGQVLVGR